MNHKNLINKCITLAKKGVGHVSPNPMVGCVIVKNNKIIAEGYHHEFGKQHAEIDALDKIKGNATGATLYVNLEPCSFKGKTEACTDRIIKEKISKVIFGTYDPNPKVSGKGAEKLKKAGIQVISGIEEEDCRLLNQFFFKFIKTGLPYVTLKIAQTTDNFIAYPDGSCPHITNIKSRTFVHKMRNEYDSVLVGKNTLIKDNPALTIRHVSGRQPYRLILDTHAEVINSSKKILNDEHTNKTFWIVSENAEFKNPYKIKVIKCRSKNNHIDLKDMLKTLSKKNIISILVEGGPQIWHSFLEENLVDQIQLFTSNKTFEQGIKALPDQNPENMRPKIQKTRQFDSDLLEKKYFKIY
jgi:diaminohydroxyphosphoribosylaminopyrimidine deaminase/5-amino-6-(5-phosphoribosylamino)uracil reductase